MAFTDEDLKRLKDHVFSCGNDCQTCIEMKLPQFIARLEAAEKVIKCFYIRRGKRDTFEYYLDWRKAAGKK